MHKRTLFQIYTLNKHYKKGNLIRHSSRIIFLAIRKTHTQKNEPPLYRHILCNASFSLFFFYSDYQPTHKAATLLSKSLVK